MAENIADGVAPTAQYGEDRIAEVFSREIAPFDYRLPEGLVAG